MTFKEIYDSIYSNEETKNPDSFIKHYEENITLIENHETDSENDYYDVMRLTSDYAHNLTIKESYTKALPFLDKAVQLYENFSGFDNEKLLENNFYQLLRFDRASANYYLKNFSIAQSEFKWLNDTYPENDKFKLWMTHTKFRKHDSLLKILWYIIAGSVLATTFIEKESIGFLYDIVLYFGTIALVIAIALESIKYINKRKINAS